MPLMDFLRPKWKHSDKDVRMAAVARGSSDQTALAEVAREDNISWVRMAAVAEAHRGRRSLAEVALNAGRLVDVRGNKAAVKKLMDQGMLTEIASKDSNGYVRMAAVEKLTDQAALAEIARKDGISGRALRLQKG